MTRQYLYSCASKASDAESRCVPLKEPKLLQKLLQTWVLVNQVKQSKERTFSSPTNTCSKPDELRRGLKLLVYEAFSF